MVTSTVNNYFVVVGMAVAEAASTIRIRTGKILYTGRAHGVLIEGKDVAVAGIAALPC